MYCVESKITIPSKKINPEHRKILMNILPAYELAINKEKKK
jgi:hypothetical protein